MKHSDPAVSVIIPARDAEATIAAALKSLAPDGALIGEVLLIDDRSDDETVTIAKTAAVANDLPLSVIPTNVGSAGAARNIGLAAARFPFVFFLDADDRVEPSGLAALHRALVADPESGLAIGAHVRRTDGRADKLKTPEGYGADRRRNAHDYLLGKMWPIAMGSALFRRQAADGFRFPEDAALDEDTCFWAGLLSRVSVVTVNATVLVYRLNEARTGRRYSTTPRATFVGVAGALGKLGRRIGDREAVQWRKAWVALRIARQLLYERRHADAQGMLRAVAAHPAFVRSWRLTRYRFRAKMGKDPALSRSSTNRLPLCRGRYKTLVLTVDPAWPPVSGADLRNAQNAIAAACFGPVMLVSMRPTGLPAASPAGVEVVSVGDHEAPKQRSHFEGWESKEAIARALDVIRAFGPDAIIVEGIHLYPLLRDLRDLAQTLVLDMHNIESELSTLIHKTNPKHTLKGMLRLEPRVLRRRERDAIYLVDRVWVCSQADATRLYRLHRPPVPVSVVPNGIPRLGTVPADLPVRERKPGGPRILFFSHLGYRPNITAARRLAEGILPAVRQSLPGAGLVLAGRAPGRKVLDLADLAGVSLIGDPPDADAVLAAADIVAVPLEAGGGTRLKILEAMAWGLPVVATPIAAEGLDLEDGIEFMPATTDEQFARAIVDLWCDGDRFEALRRRARDTAMLRFGAPAIERAVRNGLGLSSRNHSVV